MKVLITGGCGFLGSNLAASYLSQGAEVVVVDALFRRGSSVNLAWLETKAVNGQFHFIQADLANGELVTSVFRRYAPFDYICHVGGQVAMTTSLQDPARDLQTNVIGTFNVLEATRLLSPDALVAYSSTNKVYGDLEWLRYEETESRYYLPDYPEGLDESLPLDFSTPYGCSKGAADQYVRDWARVYGLKTVIFRHSSIYGGRQFASFDQGWVGWFCQQAILQADAHRAGTTYQPFSIAGTGKQVRDVLHAKDLINLYHIAYQHKDKLSGNVFNIGGGIRNSLSLLELFSLLEDELKIVKLDYYKQDRRSSDQDFFVASIDKAFTLLGWKPSINNQEGIHLMLEWCVENLQRRL
jgi:CDP-paratose 2-epimerase